MIKKILITLSILVIPAMALAVTGDSARFDFTQGQPTIIDDTSTTCNNQATIRYDFVSGEPKGVYDTTATCTASVVVATVTNPPTVQVQGQVIINGQIIIR